jgi:O-antigen/teichoic acid export membrane protein
MSLGERTVKGVIWNYLSFASGKFLTFISMVVLARLLVPEQFGVVALALLAIQYLDALGDLGISEALIYQRDNLERASNVAFIISVLSGIGLAAVAVIGAPYFAAFYNEPALTPMLQVLALSLIITSFGQTQMALLTKDMRFRQKMVPDLSRTLVKGLASIGLALFGFGAWSLVWGQVLGALATTIALWAVSRWRPRLMWDGPLARQMLSYGGQVLGIQLLSVVWATADYLIVGKLLGRAELAYYQQAFRVTDLLIINIAFVVGKVLFPSYTKMSRDPAQLEQGYLSTIRYMALATLPLSLGVCIVAPIFVRLVFGPQWVAMTPALQLLAIRAGLSTLSFNGGHLLKAIGKPAIVNYQVLAKLAVLVLVVFLTVPYGFVAVAAGQVGVAIFVVLMDFLTIRWQLGFSLANIWRQIQPALVSTIGMGLIVWLIVVSTPVEWQLAGLVGAVLIGGLSYVGLLWLTNRELFVSSVQSLSRMMRRKQPAIVKHSEAG